MHVQYSRLRVEWNDVVWGGCPGTLLGPEGTGNRFLGLGRRSVSRVIRESGWRPVRILRTAQWTRASSF